ncbi:MAG: M23 family metallopeptidase [Rikenellaceae bacterium]|nr:M23 family metallopeptidase [Rikenellaceae bacterium]MBR2451590.1 M23 family metallopeptidase [Rikenellaceae bacterium]
MTNNKNTKRNNSTRSQSFGWIIRGVILLGIIVGNYILFSWLFDTPVERQMKQSTALLEEQYRILSERYDSLVAVLDNVAERDRNVSRVLFEADPYDLKEVDGVASWQSREKLMSKTNRELSREFYDKMQNIEYDISYLNYSYNTLRSKIDNNKDAVRNIPAIQPIINTDLTLLTSSFGLRIHPFYRTLTPHKGVDYTVPEGTRVFATADGVVKKITTRNTGSGLTLVLEHEGGYETTYSHLRKVTVRRGNKVRRGDIIALTGNSGLSLAPHLHYEIKYNGLRVDPIHYFFMELSPVEYQRIMRIAQSGMQSFD